MPIDVVIAGPFQDRPAGELRPIVRDDASWLPVDTHKRVQFAGYTCAGYARVGHPLPPSHTCFACAAGQRDRRFGKAKSAERGHRFSRQQSSFTANMRNLRPSHGLHANHCRAVDAPNVSDTKSNDPADRQVIAGNHREGALAGAQSHRHRRSRSTRTFAAPSSSDARLFLSIKPVQLLMVHEHSFALQQHADPPLSSKLRFDCRATDNQTADAC